jgi:hypothetical protein
MSALAPLEQQSACSIFESVIEVFHDLFLEGNHARLSLPPLCASVTGRFKRGDRELDGASSKFIIEHPSHPTSGKNFGRDDDPRNAVLIGPISLSNRFIPRAPVFLPEHPNGIFRYPELLAATCG